MDITTLAIGFILGLALGRASERVVPLHHRPNGAIVAGAIAVVSISLLILHLPPTWLAVALGYAIGFGLSWARRVASRVGPPDRT
jgi:hypothetical protein